MSPTTPVFVESMYKFYMRKKIQVPNRPTLTLRSEIAGIPIIYHKKGILSGVNVNLRIRL